MGRERLYRTEAVILKRTDFGEADRVVTLYTPHLGKFRAVAKGVRRLTSRKAGHLELFTHAQLLLAAARSLDIITQAETVRSYPALRADLARASRAYYAAELLDRFTGEGIENRPLFELLLKVLAWLDAEPNIDLLMRFYELHLLELVGYRPQLFHCVTCGAVIEPVVNYFSPSDGGVVCPRCGRASPSPETNPIAVNSLKALRYLQTHSFEAVRRLRLKPALHRDLEQVMLRYLTYHLERELKSVEFLRLAGQPVVQAPEVSGDSEVTNEAVAPSEEEESSSR